MIDQINHVSFLGLEEARHPDAFALRVPRDVFPAARSLSWAIRGGGCVVPEVLVNHSIAPEDEATLTKDPDGYVDAFMERHGFPKATVVLMTTVTQEFLGCAEKRCDESGLAVRAYATVGLGNARAAGDPAGIVGKSRYGTINIIVAVLADLSDEAMLESIAIATEAKTRFLNERRVVSEISDAIATGTGTDCMAVLSLGKGEQIRFAGKHTKVGELIACAAIDAMNESVERRLAAYREQDRTDTV